MHLVSTKCSYLVRPVLHGFVRYFFSFLKRTRIGAVSMIYDLSLFLFSALSQAEKVNFPGENARRRSADRICKLTALSQGRLSC
jgi:hypothetical protein